MILQEDLIYRDFWDACIQGDVPALLNIIDEIDEIDKKNDKGWSGIIMAAFNHNFKVLSILLDNGANINDMNEKGTTVFMYAKTKCLNTENFKILNYLLENGADINAKDKKRNWTVLDYVYELENTTLAAFIQNNGGKFSYE